MKWFYRIAAIFWALLSLAFLFCMIVDFKMSDIAFFPLTALASITAYLSSKEPL